MKSLFQLKFTAKQLNQQSKRCQKDEVKEKAKLKKAIQDGNMEGARIYAANAIRKKNEALNLLRLSSRIDAVSSRVQTAVTMRKISLVMDKFETQFEDLDVQTEYMEGAMAGTTTMTTPQNEVEILMQQVADEHGLEMKQELGRLEPGTSLGEAKHMEKDEDAMLTERLKALRQ
ncbi:Vacuolar-sorting protein SNF7 [Apophysomyces ossiformis]|uniref:Vacuolar-sorting protein SNF7 n=1 Tax=Apophysomyces ossiformis TaxID=679940 RepID=A0A8H7BV55_9FUNG|nr:Vacuolar-sorting protein SNF7 [Apophysomyces ossiformis]